MVFSLLKIITMPPSNEPREEFIEYDILDYLSKKIPLVYHNDIKGYCDQLYKVNLIQIVLSN